MSGASGDALARYVADGDVASLTRLPGIGKKTAERIIVELRDKLEGLPISPGPAGAGAGGAAAGALREATDALTDAGLQARLKSPACCRTWPNPDMSAEEIIRKALQKAAA